MFENMKKGWALARATRKLVFGDRSLFIYPVLAAIISFIEFLAIFGSLVLSTFSVGAAANGSANTAAFIVALVIYYFIVIFTSTYFLMAMMIAFKGYLKGNRISIGEAMSQTAQYTKLIVQWALFYTFVIMLIQILESRFRGIGRVLIGTIASMVVALATFFAIQIILDKRLGPVGAVKESTKFIIAKFGKTFGGIVYSDLYALGFILGGIAAMALGGFLSAFSIVAGVVVLVAGFVLLVAGIIINFVLVNIYKLILYEYSNGGALPPGIDKNLVDGSIRKKAASGGLFGNKVDDAQQ